ncbi:hypothetical protein [Aquabacter spiritensis]|uniref:Uncharacterized protein n=1 Tax=Aquabacter spiritensis TaxID=933073 RepID=A0A4R3M3L7_9HYPH|nr:hypothetical protein [Aquabacter spiritensis]TCT07612.1 hypothetical protein EDC64_101131 [Aquabacter spiritensis]
MTGIGLDIPSAALLRRRHARPTRAAQTAALIARMAVPPPRAGAIDILVRALIAAGIWAKLDALYLLAAHDAQAARLNWIQDAYTLATLNSPAFIPNRGYVGDGVTQALSTGFNAATAGGRYTQDSASFGAWSLTEAVEFTALIGADSGPPLRLAYIFPLPYAFLAMVGVNCGEQTYTDNSTSLGLFAASRTGPAGFTTYRNATVFAVTSLASVEPPNAPFYLMGQSRNGGVDPAHPTSRTIAMGFIGAGLTGQEMADLHAATQTYLTEVGAL